MGQCCLLRIYQDATSTGGLFPPEDIFQRMVHRNNFKFNYYHGQHCQFFHLDAEPRELNDLAADPAHAETVVMLEAKVLTD